MSTFLSCTAHGFLLKGCLLVQEWWKENTKEPQGISFCLRALVTSVTCEVYLELPLAEANAAVANHFYRVVGGNSTFLVLHTTVLLPVGTAKYTALPPVSHLFWTPGFSWPKMAAASCYLCEALNHDSFLTHLSITLSVKKKKKKVVANISSWTHFYEVSSVVCTT